MSAYLARHQPRMMANSKPQRVNNPSAVLMQNPSPVSFVNNSMSARFPHVPEQQPMTTFKPNSSKQLPVMNNYPPQSLGTFVGLPHHLHNNPPRPAVNKPQIEITQLPIAALPTHSNNPPSSRFKPTQQSGQVSEIPVGSPRNVTPGVVKSTQLPRHQDLNNDNDINLYMEKIQ